MQRTFASGVVVIFITTFLFLAFIPTLVAAEGQVVVFLSGHCNSPDACRAGQQIYDSLKSKLPAGTRLLIPPLTNKAYFPTDADASKAASSLGSDKVVFLVYSGGYAALQQVVGKMNTGQLQNVKTMVSLEADYPGFHSAVNTVKKYNPSVDVRMITSGQFKTNHGLLPGNEGVARAIAGLVGGDPNALPITNTAYDPNRPLTQQFSFAQAPYSPPINSSMPASYQAPLTSAFTPTAAPSPYTPSVTPGSQSLVIPPPPPSILPPPVMTSSLFTPTSIAAPKTSSTVGAPISTKVLAIPQAPSTFTSGPMTTWSAPLAVFDVRQEMARALSSLENFLKGLLRRF